MIPDLTSAEIARFYSKLRIGGCGVTWAGGDVHTFGYGHFAIYRQGKRKRILAHRLAYKLATGEDPGDAEVRHGCDIPPCCTPDCLVLGTQADNIRDAVERGRLNVTGLTAYRTARDAAALARIGSGVKRCSKCGQTKPLGDYFASRDCLDGRAYWCKACCLDHQRERRRMKREAI